MKYTLIIETTKSSFGIHLDTYTQLLVREEKREVLVNKKLKIYIKIIMRKYTSEKTRYISELSI
jgi:hypothetical protein